MNRSTAISIGISLLRGERPSPAARARIWAALDPRASALLGHACEVSVEEGDAPARSRRQKPFGGSFVRDIPEQAIRDGRERWQ